MFLRRMLRALLEPARDPLHDSLAASLERVAALRSRLEAQIAGLRPRALRLDDHGLREQLRRLEAEQARLLQVEQRLAADCDAWRARHELLTARQTAAEAHLRLAELLEALDAAHARAAALAELSATISEEALCPPSVPPSLDSLTSR